MREMEKTDAISRANFIQDIILRLGFDSEQFRSECYDGCATMMGKKKGVATQIKSDIKPLALSTHCHTHSLNVACGDWIRNAAAISKPLEISYEITKLVKFSTKRDSHLRKIHEEEYYENEENCSSKFTTLRLFGGTRWTVRAGSWTSIYGNYQELEELWRWCLIEYKDREVKARVLGVQVQMRTFDYFYGLRLGILLQRHSDNLRASLQTKDLFAAEAQTIVKYTVATLEKMGTDENCHLFWEVVKQKATKLDVDAPKLSRKRRSTTRMEEFFGRKAAPENANDVMSHYRRIYFISLDCII